MHRWVNGKEFKVVHLCGSPSVGAGSRPFDRISIGFLWSLRRQMFSSVKHLLTYYLTWNNEISIQVSIRKPYCSFSTKSSQCFSVHSTASNHNVAVDASQSSSPVAVVLWPWWNNQKEGQTLIFQPWAVLSEKIVSSFTKSSEAQFYNRELCCHQGHKFNKVTQAQIEKGYFSLQPGHTVTELLIHGTVFTNNS